MAIVNRNQTRKVYSFKSAGSTKRSSDNTPVAKQQKPPIGIRTPLEISSSKGLFTMHTDVGKLIADNLRNLIQTNHGERLGFYDFGANLRPLVFNLGSEDADKVAIDRIAKAISKYMPFVSPENFQVFIDRFDNEEVAKVGIVITYTIPRINNDIRRLEVLSLIHI